LAGRWKFGSLPVAIPIPFRGGLALIESRACKLRAGPTVHIEHGAKRFYVSGMVQGVGYRYFARRAALRLGLSGYVRNLSDGRVEVYAVGPAAELEALGTDLRHGPSTATVSSVTEEEAPLDPRFAQAFSIEFEP